MANFARSLVSKQKRRYNAEGFNLDLTYITDNIIAMGFPSEKLEGLYRNPMADVVKFLDSRHPGKYKVYNLCSERSYEESRFNGPVARYPFDDHNAPPFSLILPFCRDVDAWLNDKTHVAAIHCKAGKGRTGVLICCYLLYERKFNSADAAIKFYGNARTKNGKGVTIPSQLRYIRYFSYLLKHALSYTPVPRSVTQLFLNSLPKLPTPTVSMFFCITQDNILVHTSAPILNPRRFSTPTVSNSRPSAVSIDLSQLPPLIGDIKFSFYVTQKKYGKERHVLLFQFWVNTFFIKGNALQLTKSELDKANKDKTHRTFAENFHVTLTFVGAEKSDFGEDDPNLAPISNDATTNSANDSDSDSDDDSEEEEEEEDDENNLPSDEEVPRSPGKRTSLSSKEDMLKKLIEQQLTESAVGSEKKIKPILEVTSTRNSVQSDNSDFSKISSSDFSESSGDYPQEKKKKEKKKKSSSGKKKKNSLESSQSLSTSMPSLLISTSDVNLKKKSSSKKLDSLQIEEKERSSTSSQNSPITPNSSSSEKKKHRKHSSLSQDELLKITSENRDKEKEREKSKGKSKDQGDEDNLSKFKTKDQELDIEKMRKKSRRKTVAVVLNTPRSPKEVDIQITPSSPKDEELEAKAKKKNNRRSSLVN